MTESRYASLSGSLLARKGGAKPAMRPRHITGAMLDDLGWNDMGHGVEPQSEHVPSPIAALTPSPRAIREGQVREDEIVEVEDHQAPVPVVEQQRALADQFPTAEEETFEGEEPVETPFVSEQHAEIVQIPKRRASTPKTKLQVDSRKSAFTLRLDSSRHLRLRLATAVTGRSAQQLVTAALDQFIESLPEVGTLAEQLPAASKRS